MPPTTYRRQKRFQPSLEQRVIQLVTSGKDTLDPEGLKVIKDQCREGGDPTVNHVYDILLAQMGRRHAQIRLGALLLVQDFFPRSKTFRLRVVRDLPRILELGACAEGSRLPLPIQYGKQLQDLLISLIESWHASYAARYPELEIARRHIQRSGLFQKHQEEERALQQRESHRRLEREMVLRRITDQLQEQRPDLEKNLQEMDTCFQLLVPGFPESFEGSNETHSSAPTLKERPIQEIIQELGLGSSKYSLNVAFHPGHEGGEETVENHVIFEQLRENHRLALKHRRALDAWSKSLEGIENQGSEDWEDLERRMEDLRLRIKERLEKSEELLKDRYEGFDVRGEEEGRGRSDGNVSTEEEEEEFVEVIPGMDEEESVIQPHHPTEVDDASETRKEKNGNQDRCEEADKASHPSYDNAEEGKELEGSPGRTDPSSSAPREELTERERLLQTAPVVEWGEDLMYWDSSDIPDMSTGMEVNHRFLGAFGDKGGPSKEALQMMRLRARPYRRTTPITKVTRKASPPDKDTKGEEGKGEMGGNGDTDTPTFGKRKRGREWTSQGSLLRALGREEGDSGGLDEGGTEKKSKGKSALTPLRKPQEKGIDRLKKRLYDPQRQRRAKQGELEEEKRKQQSRQVFGPGSRGRR